MINGKNVIAIIPARGGSKGLPKKNIRPLLGKPLIAWTIEAAKNSTFIDKILVSTDCPSIKEVALNCGAEAPFTRPRNLSTDTATTIDVVKHSLNFFSGTEFDYVILLEPTSPIRERNDIDLMLSKLDSNCEKYDSIISLGLTSEHPSILKKIDGETYKPYAPNLPITTRRQDNDSAYFPFGVAYIAKTKTLLEESSFYTKRSTWHLIKRYQQFEIDDIYDFYCTEAIMKQLTNIRD